MVRWCSAWTPCATGTVSNAERTACSGLRRRKPLSQTADCCSANRCSDLRRRPDLRKSTGCSRNKLKESKHETWKGMCRLCLEPSPQGLVPERSTPVRNLEGLRTAGVWGTSVGNKKAFFLKLNKGFTSDAADVPPRPGLKSLLSLVLFEKTRFHQESRTEQLQATGERSLERGVAAFPYKDGASATTARTSHKSPESCHFLC